jgi:hypothetical protein
MGWSQTYELLAKLSTSSRRRRGSKPQEQQTQSTCATDVAGNPAQIPNPYLDEAHRRSEGRPARIVGRWRVAIRRAKILRANLRRGIQAQRALQEANPSSNLYLSSLFNLLTAIALRRPVRNSSVTWQLRPD